MVFVEAFFSCQLPQGFWVCDPGNDMKVATPPSVTEDITALLVTEANTSSFNGLIPRPSEPIGAYSLFFSPSTAHYVISTMLLSLIAASEVTDMVRLVKGAL